MSTIELVKRFTEKQRHEEPRSPGVIVIEFGGGNCNKAGDPSCKDFCAVPNGKFYNPELDPSLDMIVDQFRNVAELKPAIVSLVPNGEAVITYQKSNTSWSEIFNQQQLGNLSNKQVAALLSYYSNEYGCNPISPNQEMSPAAKMAVTIGLGNNLGLNLSLTTNGSFLDKKLLELYRQMGLDYMNLSYHPNKPFDLKSYDPALAHLISKANEAIEVGIIPTITHVLTRQNADTYVALVDYVTEHDILFGVGIANAKGGEFSTNNISIEPTDEQVKRVFRRLLARRLFADRHIRTTIPYLLLAPFLRHWVCNQSTDFFHLSIEQVKGKLQSKMNVCSEVRDDKHTPIEAFFIDGKLDTESYLKWRDNVMKDSEHGCKTCTHQCYFESETRGTLGIGLGVDKWDLYTTAGKGARQRYTFRHPLRPTISRRKDFQKPYLWESLLQGVTRIVASLKGDPYWQEAFKRSGTDYRLLIAECMNDATNSCIITELVKEEEKDEQIKIWNTERDSAVKRSPTYSSTREWHDANYLQSKIFRAVYLPFQKSGKEAEIAVPTVHFKGILEHQSNNNFQQGIEDIIAGKRKQSLLTKIKEDLKGIYKLTMLKKPRCFFKFSSFQENPFLSLSLKARRFESVFQWNPTLRKWGFLAYKLIKKLFKPNFLNLKPSQIRLLYQSI